MKTTIQNLAVYLNAHVDGNLFDVVNDTVLTMKSADSDLLMASFDPEHGVYQGLPTSLLYTCLDSGKARRQGMAMYEAMYYTVKRNFSMSTAELMETLNGGDALCITVLSLMADDIMNHTTINDMKAEDVLSILDTVNMVNPILVDDYKRSDVFLRMFESDKDMRDMYDYECNLDSVLTEYTDDYIIGIMEKSVRNILGKRSHRGVRHDPMRVLKASIASIAVPVTVEEKRDADGNIIVLDDGVTTFPEFKATGTPEMYTQFPTNRSVQQMWSNLFHIGQDVYAEMGVSTGNRPLFIYVGMEQTADDKKRIKDAIAKMEENGDTNNVVYETYKKVIEWEGVSDIEDILNSIFMEHVLRYGFNYNGDHYTYVLSTQSQFRSGVGTFMLDPNGDGWKFAARVQYKLTGAADYYQVVNDAESMEEEEGANFIFREMQKRVKGFRNDKFMDTEDEHYKVGLSKLLGRFGLTASSAFEQRKVAEYNHSDSIMTAKAILENAKMWIVEDGKIDVLVSGKTIKLTPKEEEIDGVTHNAEIVDIKNKHHTEVVADGGAVMQPLEAAAASHLGGWLTSDEFLFFVEKFDNYYNNTEYVRMAAEDGKKDAKELVRLMSIIRSCTQVRFDGQMTGVKGMIEILDWNCFPEAHDIVDEDGVALADYGFILPRSTVKFLADNGLLDASNMWVCNTNKTHDVDSMGRTSAQYISDLTKWTGDDASKVVDLVMDDLVKSVNMTSPNYQDRIQALIQQDLVGREAEFSVFNTAAELAKANIIMTQDKNFLEYQANAMGRAMSNLAKGTVPSKGEYLFLAFDPNEAFNAWFKEEMYNLGYAPRKTLRDFADEWGISGPVCYLDGYQGKVGIFRSPSNSPYEAQALTAVNMPELWYLNDCVVVCAVDGTARRAGGADHDGDKVKPVKDNTPVNKLIVSGIDTNAPELLVDPKEIANMMGDKKTKDMALTVSNSVKLLKKNLRRSMIGQISKWSMAYAALAAHLSETVRIALSNNCKGIYFTAPEVEQYSWQVAMSDPAMACHDEWHKKTIDFLLDDKKQSNDTFRTNPSVDKNFKAYEIKGGILFVEGYIEHHYDRELKKFVPTVDKKTKKCVGWYGMKTMSEVKAKIQECINNNLINGAAQGIEIDATNNGYGSFFHVKANFMGVHELYRDFMKDKKKNGSMVHSSYISIAPLGVLFTATMKRWNEVMVHVDQKKARDMTGYMSLLCNEGEVNNTVYYYGLAIEAIRKEYLDGMEEIRASFGNDEDEKADIIAATKRLVYKTRIRLLSLTDNKNAKISKYAIAVAVWAAGKGGSFSFVMAEELRELLKNDPNAFGIERLPRYFDENEHTVRMVDKFGTTWLTIEKWDDRRDELVYTDLCKVNGVINRDGKTLLFSDSNGRHYAVYGRKATDSTQVLARTKKMAKSLWEKMYVNMVGCKIDGIDDVLKLRNFVDTSIAWKDGQTHPGYIKVKVNMGSDGVMYWTKEGTPYVGKLDFGFINNALPAFTVNMVAANYNCHEVILNLTKANLTNTSYTNVGICFVYNF